METTLGLVLYLFPAAAQEYYEVITEDGHLMKAFWWQPAVSVAVVTS